MPHPRPVYPGITNGKLCAKDLFDGKLAALQTEFWKVVGEKYGLDRGEPNSQAEHLDTAEYKAKKIVEAAEQKRAEAEEYSEALQQAVTADNADLKKRLDKVMQETLDIDKENKELKAYKVRAAKALELLAKLECENPSAYNALFDTKKKPPVSSSKNWWAK